MKLVYSINALFVPVFFSLRDQMGDFLCSGLLLFKIKVNHSLINNQLTLESMIKYVLDIVQTFCSVSFLSLVCAVKQAKH